MYTMGYGAVDLVAGRPRWVASFDMSFPPDAPSLANGAQPCSVPCFALPLNPKSR